MPLWFAGAFLELDFSAPFNDNLSGPFFLDGFGDHL